MGLLRFFLAFVVFCGHSSANFNTWITSTEAVRGFYVISGFLMALILSHPTKYRSYSEFVTNRFLRLWPCFICVTLMTLTARIFADSILLKEFLLLPPLSKFLTTLPNLFMVGSDWICFFSTNADIRLIWESPEKSLVNFLLIPQAWTLGIEFSFYLIVYFIFRERWFFYFVLVISIYSNFVFWKINFDPISYRFFLSELIYFFVGIFSQKFGILVKNKRSYSFIKYFLIMFFFLAFIFVNLSVYFYATLFFLLPEILIADKWSTSHFLGQISYPFYLIHKLSVWCTSFILSKYNFIPIIHFVIELFASSAGAIVLYFLVIRPFDVYRKTLKGWS